MSKRFTDTNKWRKVWFRSLSPVEKCFWLYICDNCDHAGIWEVDFDLAQIFIGENLNVPAIKESFRKQYEEIGSGKKWFIRDFIDFQYGELNEANRAHFSVISILKKEGAYKGLIRGIQGRKDKDKDKDKDKEGGMGGNGDAYFDTFWKAYPKKIGKADAVKAWGKLAPQNGTIEKIMTSLEQWKKTTQWTKDNGEFIPHASTWLNKKRFEDEIPAAEIPAWEKE